MSILLHASIRGLTIGQEIVLDAGSSARNAYICRVTAYLFTLGLSQKTVLLGLVVLALVADETSEDLLEGVVDFDAVTFSTSWSYGRIHVYG